MSKALSLFLIAAAVVAAGCKDEAAPSVDAVPFSEFRWTWGGFNGSGAALDAPRISNLSVAVPSSLAFRWDVDMRSWGYAHGDPKGVACLFVRQGDRWVGGKFEWISSSRNTRGLENVRHRYEGWDPGALNQAREIAFVVVSGDGRRRSNVAVWRR
jgi:hypothetical protein